MTNSAEGIVVIIFSAVILIVYSVVIDHLLEDTHY